MKKSYYIIFIVLMSMHVSSKATGEKNNADKLDALVKVASSKLNKNKKNNKPQNRSNIRKDLMRGSKVLNKKFFRRLNSGQCIIKIPYVVRTFRGNSMPYKIFYSQLRMNKYAVDYQIILEDK